MGTETTYTCFSIAAGLIGLRETSQSETKCITYLKILSKIKTKEKGNWRFLVNAVRLSGYEKNIRVVVSIANERKTRVEPAPQHIL